VAKNQEAGAMKRKPPTKREALERLNASHLRVLKAFRHQTDEIAQLRRYVLSMHAMFARHFQVQPEDEPIFFGKEIFTDGRGNDISHLVKQ
jgi:hypothetical protein